MLNFIFLSISLLIAITIHEFAHAWTADTLGDPTPRINGRLSLNPLAHLDPLGVISLILIHFGWGKPVPIDSYNLTNPKRDTLLIALAGPASNLLLALGLSSIIHFFPTLPIILIYFLNYLLSLNLALAVFNLVPIYPLDGANILTGLLPHNLAIEYQTIMRQYGTLLLIFALLPIGGISPISSLISPIISWLNSILLGTL